MERIGDVEYWNSAESCTYLGLVRRDFKALCRAKSVSATVIRKGGEVVYLSETIRSLSHDAEEIKRNS